MPTVVEIIKRWNPEIEKYLERKFDCYYQYEDDNVVAESVHVRITVIHKYTHYTVGKVIKFHSKSTQIPVLEKLLSELTPVVTKVIGYPIFPLNFNDLLSVADSDSPYDWEFGVLNRYLLWKDRSTNTCKDGHYFDCMCHSFDASHNLNDNL